MSQENAEVVRAAHEAWNAGDMDALRELYDPDAIVRAPEGWPEPGPFVGREAVMRQFEQFRSTWNSDTLEPITGFNTSGDRVLVRVVLHGAGHVHGGTSIEATQVFTVREGKVCFRTSGITPRPSKPPGCRSR
jgi:ketosteroid isomerase-like protein